MSRPTHPSEAVKAYLTARADRELELAGEQVHASSRALHEGKAAGMLYAAKDHRRAADLAAQLAEYRGTAASRAHEGMRFGRELGGLLVEYATNALVVA